MDYRDLLRRWLAGMPAEWGYTEENRTEPVRGAALPMGFNRTPHYSRGLLLAGDAGGMVNPFNGEGIAYAMETGEMAAQVIAQALARPDRAGTEQVLHGYPQALKDAYGGYYTLGRKFVRAIGDPRVMQFATKHGMPHPALMRFIMKLLANLTEARGGDAADRVINALSKMTPAASARPRCRIVRRRRKEAAVLVLYVPIIVLGALAAFFAIFSLIAGHAERAAAVEPGQTRSLRVRHRADAAPRSAAGSRSSTT